MDHLHDLQATSMVLSSLLCYADNGQECIGYLHVHIGHESTVVCTLFVCMFHPHQDSACV